jgi:Zn finger protein HypA/HybF involved in hydrogenase expression
VQSFRCPTCGERCGDLRQGRELEIDSIEIEDGEETA